MIVSFKCWLAGKLIKTACRLMDDETRREVFALLAAGAERGFLDRSELGT
jgi:hypothetical protein